MVVVAAVVAAVDGVGGFCCLDLGDDFSVP